MYHLKLAAGECLCCGVCLDVCVEGALALRAVHGPGVEGACGPGVLEEPAASYPYLAAPQRCTGCQACVRECPTGALQLLDAQALARHVPAAGP